MINYRNMLSPQKSADIKLLSYNIHKGFGIANFQFTLKNIRDAIKALNLDLVFLQEVQGEHQTKSKIHHDWPTQSQFEYLADQTWHHYAYGKNAVYDDGHHGNAILSKYPIVEWENINVSTNRIEKRGILYAKIDIKESGKYLHCLCLHLDLLRKGQSSQLLRLCDIVMERVNYDESLIIAGDFNDWAKQASKVMVEKLGVQEIFKTLHGKYAKTYPSHAPVLGLDRVYFRALQATDAKVMRGKVWNRLSDHLALFADLKL